MFKIGDKVTLDDAIYDHWEVPRGTVMEVAEINRGTLGYRVAPSKALRRFGPAGVNFFWVDGGKMHPAPTEGEKAPQILDSGERTEYQTGAVRDCKAGKGRCDLMPLDVLDRVIDPADKADKQGVLWYLDQFRRLGQPQSLAVAIKHFATEVWRFTGPGEAAVPALLLEASKHFEEGAKKYGPDNWRKGIPVHSYIDSAARHYLKYRAGWVDEPHDRAFVWNLMCCLWTMEHYPELDDFTEKGRANNERTENKNPEN